MSKVFAILGVSLFLFSICGLLLVMAASRPSGEFAIVCTASANVLAVLGVAFGLEAARR